MSGLRALLKDRRRSQRGGVLSGVLIMTAFVAIISGALMTELSSTFVLSSDLMSQLTNRATVSSAIEESVGSLRANGYNLDSPCPALTQVTVNNRTAVPSYASCWPAVDRRSPQFQSLLTAPAPFNLESVHVQVGGLDDYLVADAAGNLYDYAFGDPFTRWRIPASGALTGPPLVVQNPNNSNQYLDVIPLAGAGCAPSPNCLAVRVDASNISKATPSALCTTQLTAAALVQPTNGYVASGTTIFFAQGQLLGAQNVTNCSQGTTQVSGSQPIVVAPIAFQCVWGCKKNIAYVYAVVSDGVTSSILRYGYGAGFLYVSTLALPWGGVVSGIAASSATLPANLAVSYASGGVALVQLSSGGSMTLAGSQPTSPITGAPYWCQQCPSPLVAVGGTDGTVHIFDASLNPYATSSSIGSSISTSPAADDAGDWYVGTDDGYIHELQVSGSQLTEVNSYGPMGRFGSSVQVGPCPVGICVYAATLSSVTDEVLMDAREAVISACISTAPPACSGANPRLWAQVEVGASNDPAAVHVRGWSYYSP